MDSYNAHEDDGAESTMRRALAPPPSAREHPVAITFPTGMKITRRKRTARRTGEVRRVSEPTGVEKTEAMDCYNASVEDGAESSTRRALPPPSARREHPAVETVTAGMKVVRRKRTARRMGEVLQRVSEPPSVEKTEEVRAMDCYNAHEEDGAGTTTRLALLSPSAREHRAVEAVAAEKEGKRKREPEAPSSERMEEVRVGEEPQEKRRARPERPCDVTKRITATDAKRDQNRLEVGLDDFAESMPFLELALKAHSLPYNVPVPVPASDGLDHDYTFMFSYITSNCRYRFRGPDYAKFLKTNLVAAGQVMTVSGLPAGGSALNRRFAFVNSNQ